VGPHPNVAAVRRAVRISLAEFTPGDLVFSACSGGADSLALAAAVAFEAPRAGLRAGGVVVDHGLQPGSVRVADEVAGIMTQLGLDPALRVAVTVAGPEDVHPYPGPEAAARTARYEALDAAAAKAGAAAIALGHTMDDQAETVLLRLARGAGARSLAGMAPHSASPGDDPRNPRACRYLRPLLDLRRDQTRQACAALGLRPWDDPQNEDPAFARVRVRRSALPALEAALGPGVTEALARTARLLRADADALDELAAAESARLLAEADAGSAEAAATAGWPAAQLAALPDAVRRRILRRAALAAGCPAGALTERHVLSLDDLVVGWHGQRWTDLPGGIRGYRRYGRLLFRGGSGGRPPGWRSVAAGSEERSGHD
jgi:tRNA(Ile)-lysidine synthase